MTVNSNQCCVILFFEIDRNDSYDYAVLYYFLNILFFEIDRNDSHNYAVLYCFLKLTAMTVMTVIFNPSLNQIERS